MAKVKSACPLCGKPVDANDTAGFWKFVPPSDEYAKRLLLATAPVPEGRLHNGCVLEVKQLLDRFGRRVGA